MRLDQAHATRLYCNVVSTGRSRNQCEYLKLKNILERFHHVWYYLCFFILDHAHWYQENACLFPFSLFKLISLRKSKQNRDCKWLKQLVVENMAALMGMLEDLGAKREAPLSHRRDLWMLYRYLNGDCS